MRHYTRGIIALALLVCVSAVPLVAQAPVPAPAPAPTSSRPAVPLKVLVVISRYEGDKKVSNLPYTIAVTANDRGGSLRMGSRIPIPAQAGANTTAGFTYQEVGTNIDCSATSLDENRFKIDVSISDSSVMERRPSDGGIPTLRSLFTNNSVVLKDGQSAQFTAAADKTTGEVVKVDVTISVEK
jgi:Flp pilus assembly secretin CpaC